MSSNVSERVLRDIYLKVFEIAVRESHPRGVMTGYNRVNGVFSCNNKALLEDILRCEWGFDGVVMTDWLATSIGEAVPSLAMKAGNDLLMPGSAGDKKEILKALKNGQLAKKDLRKCAAAVLSIARNSDCDKRSSTI